ncbi:MAG: histidinol phosphatase [Actinobacteria bacterium]|nr:histidinol phosphatase [Actinomycetota bacterium]
MSQADLALALRAADVADAVSLPGFESRSFRVDHKADASEVTEIDRNTESAISDLLRRERPDYSLYGEEHGVVGPADAARQWVIDPIDGTSNFVRGVPVWATLIALVDDGTPVLGVVSAPALGMRWWAVRGGGAFYGRLGAAVDHLRDAIRLSVSDTASLDSASASITVTEAWHRAGKTAPLDALQRGVKRLRNYGDFWQHMLVAQGAVDFAIDGIGLGPYDNAAIYPIVTEAGGRVSNRHGAFDYQSDSLITSNGRLHDAVIGALEGDR